jgi:hypothetical protein
MIFGVYGHSHNERKQKQRKKLSHGLMNSVYKFTDFSVNMKKNQYIFGSDGEKEIPSRTPGP